MHVRRGVAPTSVPGLGAVYAAVLVVAAAAAAIWLRSGLPLPACPMREWTGVPCPTCGSTRLVEAILRGDMLAALAWNPLVFVGLAVVAVWAAVSAISAALGLPAIRLVLARQERIAVRVLVVGAIVGGWTYLIWRGV